MGQMLSWVAWDNQRPVSVIPKTCKAIGTHGRLWELPQVSITDQPHIVKVWIDVTGELLEFNVRIYMKDDRTVNLGNQEYTQAYLSSIKKTTGSDVNIYHLDDLEFTLPRGAVIYVDGCTVPDEKGDHPNYTIVTKYY